MLMDIAHPGMDGATAKYRKAPGPWFLSHLHVSRSLASAETGGALEIDCSAPPALLSGGPGHIDNGLIRMRRRWPAQRRLVHSQSSEPPSGPLPLTGASAHLLSVPPLHPYRCFPPSKSLVQPIVSGVCF